MFGAKGTGDTSGYGGLVRTAASTGSSERPYGSYFDEATAPARETVEVANLPKFVNVEISMTAVK